MAGHPVIPTSAAPSSPPRPALPLIGQVQTQTMSHAKFVFLIAIVIFFIALFVAAYVWMRRPDFGQKGGHLNPTAPELTGSSPGHGAPTGTSPGDEFVQMDAPPGYP
jgi:hypothetical protein